MENLNIFFLLPVSGFGGAEIHSLDLAKNLHSGGHNISFCFEYCEANSKIFRNAFEEKFSLYNLPIHIFEHRNILTSVEDQKKVAFKFLKDKEVDLVVIPAPNPFLSLGLIEACKDLNIPHVVIFHLVRMNINVSDAIRTRFLNAVSSFTRFVSVSEFCKDALTRNFKIPPNLIEVIENGVQLQKIENDYSQIKRVLGIEDKILIVTPGRFHPQKSWDTLLEAIPTIVKEHDNVHFLWSGDGEMVDELKSRIRELEIENYVSITGFVKFPYKLYPYSDLAVLPTRFEAFSLRLLEAMSCGIPIVTTDASYQDRVIVHGKSGLISKTDSVESLAENIIFALHNPLKMKAMGMNAKNLSKKYTPQRMNKSYFSLISKLMNDDGSSIQSLKCNEIEVLFDLNAMSISVMEKEVELKSFLNFSHCDVDLTDFHSVRTVLKDNRSKPSVIVFEAKSRESFFKDTFQEILKMRPFISGTFGNFLSYALNCLDEDSIISVEFVDAVFEYINNDGGVKSKLFIAAVANIGVFDAISRARFIYKFCSAEMVDSSENAKYFGFLSSIEGNESLLDLWSRGLHFYYGFIGKPEFAKFLSPAKSSKEVAVIFASHFNYPLKNGSDQRIYTFLKKYRALGLKTVLVTFHGNGERDRKLIRGLSSEFDCDVKIVYQDRNQIDRYRSAFHSLKDGSFEISRFYDEKLLLEFYNICSIYKPSVLHINYYYFGWLALAARGISDIKLILDTHDLISKRIAVFDKLRNLSGCIPTKTEHVTLDKVMDSSNLALEFSLDDSELNTLNCFDEVLFISELEMSLLSSRLVGTKSTFYPFKPEFTGIEAKDSHNSITTTALFMGSNNSLNIMGAALIEAVSVKLVQLYDFKFRIVGDVCNAMSDVDGIEKGYFVEDLMAEYQSCDFTVCPIPFGTGQNIKITESLSYGIPVVAHSGVAYSANVINGVNGLIFSSLEEFYEILARLHIDKGYLVSLQESCRLWAADYFKA